MSEKSEYQVPIIFAFLVFVGLICMIIDISVLEPQKREAIKTQLELDGISIQGVTINSPNIYIEIDDYEEFKAIMQDQNSNEIYYYSGYYYIFNSDYTLAWRIYWRTIYEVIGP